MKSILAFLAITIPWLILAIAAAFADQLIVDESGRVLGVAPDSIKVKTGIDLVYGNLKVVMPKEQDKDKDWAKYRLDLDNNALPFCVLTAPDSVIVNKKSISFDVTLVCDLGPKDPVKFDGVYLIEAIIAPEDKPRDPLVKPPYKNSFSIQANKKTEKITVSHSDNLNAFGRDVMRITGPWSTKEVALITVPMVQGGIGGGQ